MKMIPKIKMTAKIKTNPIVRMIPKIKMTPMKRTVGKPFC